MLKLVPPRQGRSPNWSIRGTYLGVRVDRTAGTPDRATARKVLAKLKGEIERGELSGRPELTFAAAALAYLNAGGCDRFIKPITDHFGPRTLAREVGQVEIDDCAVKLYPEASPATRNRQVYSPISAILRHVGIHMLRHTYATWMRAYAGLSPEELLRTGRWLSHKSLKRYDHVEALEVSLAPRSAPPAWPLHLSAIWRFQPGSAHSRNRNSPTNTRDNRGSRRPQAGA
jgi:hypothetical protein